MRAAVAVDTHLLLLRGFLLFYIHSISMQLAKAGLRHRLRPCPVVDLIAGSRRKCEDVAAWTPAGLLQSCQGLGVRVLQFNQHQQSVFPMLPFFT